MKYFLPLIVAVLFSQAAHSQITITPADMPVAGDTLVYSNAPTSVGFSPADSGANITWNYALSSDSMGKDTYLLASQVNANFANTISNSAAGYKVADSIPGLSMLSAIIPTPLPLSVTDIYTYFQQITTPRAAYVASANSYTVSNILPVAANYTDPDVWYFFPLTYGNATDSQKYSVTMSLMSLASIKESGYRKTRVDGYGTITTPFFTTPVNCIRVRSEIHEIDSITYSGTSFGIPRNSVEYKWLVNGQHYPALWITSTLTGTTETITQVRYRDTLVDSALVVATQKPAIYDITAYPNPATTGDVMLSLPADWKSYQVEVFDIQSREVAKFSNQLSINISSFPAGQYLVRVTSGVKVGYTKITRE